MGWDRKAVAKEKDAKNKAPRRIHIDPM